MSVESCPACGARNPDGARFCVACGTSLVPSCSQCGAELPEEARFCPACGIALEQREASPAGRERKLITVLFADVTGSTSLGERLDPEQVTEVMTAFFDAMREEIEAEGGTVEKYIGDAVMAEFGVPVAHEDDPARAIRAARRMQDRLERVNEELLRLHGVRLQVRIGVNTGDVVATTAPQGGEAMVVGDAVNVAARLEQIAEPGQIVVAERTARAARGFRFHEFGPLELRGRGAPVPAVLLVGESDAPQRGIPGLRAPMVGRDRELELLRTVLDRAAADARPHLVTLYGDPGVGKSRLVAEFLSVAERLDVSPQVDRGRCLPYGNDGLTYWPLAEILKRRAGVHDTDPPDVTLAAVRRLGSELLGEHDVAGAARLTAALAYTIGVEDPEFSFRDLTPRQVHTEMHTAWRAFFSALAAGGPVVTVVEDIHWADPALLDLLEDVVERAAGPIVLVCPARPELAERRSGWGGGRANVSSIVLEPLPRVEADRLVGLLLTIEALPPKLHDEILERAEGNPFFLEEILRQLIDEGAIVHEDGRWRCAAGVEGVAIPDTVQAVLAARIDLLQPAEKQLLQQAAVVGRVFWPGPLERLLNGDSEELGSVLANLEERDLVLSRLTSAMAGQPEYAFKHALIRDVAYESLPRRERPAAHATVAGWIADTAGERRLEFVELLAHHYREAWLGRSPDDEFGDLRTAAFEHLLLASADARSKLALRKAEHLAEHALELAGDDLERSLALEALGEAFYTDFRGDDAWQAFRQAAEARLSGDPSDRHAIAHLCARAVEIPTRWPGIMKNLPAPEEVRLLLARGLALVGEGDSAVRVRLLTAQCQLPFAFFYQELPNDELEAARRSGEEAVAMAMRLDDAALASAALDGVTSVLLIEGRYGAIVEIDTRRLALVPVLIDVNELGDLHSTASWSRFHVGRYREAVDLAIRGAELALPDSPSFGLHCLTWQVMGLFRLGEWDAAIAAHDRLEGLLGDRRADPPRPYLRAAAARAFMHEARGERLAADRQLDVLRSVEDVQKTRSAIGPGWAALTVARRGDFTEARQWLAALRWREGLGLKLEALCDLVAEEGSWADAPRIAAEALEHAEWAGLLALPCYARRLQGRAALATGDLEQAISSLTVASEGFGRLEARWEQACADLSLAEALLACGREEEASARLRRAAAVFDEVSSLRELERAQELLG
jgi:class 3 adenylate cyclase